MFIPLRCVSLDDDDDDAAVDDDDDDVYDIDDLMRMMLMARVRMGDDDED